MLTDEFPGVRFLAAADGDGQACGQRTSSTSQGLREFAVAIKGCLSCSSLSNCPSIIGLPKRKPLVSNQIPAAASNPTFRNVRPIVALHAEIPPRINSVSSIFSASSPPMQCVSPGPRPRMCAPLDISWSRLLLSVPRPSIHDVTFPPFFCIVVRKKQCGAVWVVSRKADFAKYKRASNQKATKPEMTARKLKSVVSLFAL